MGLSMESALLNHLAANPGCTEAELYALFGDNVDLGRFRDNLVLLQRQGKLRANQANEKKYFDDRDFECTECGECWPAVRRNMYSTHCTHCKNVIYNMARSRVRGRRVEEIAEFDPEDRFCDSDCGPSWAGLTSQAWLAMPLRS